MSNEATPLQTNYSERISSLGKQSALWAVATVASIVAGAMLAWNTAAIALPIGGAIAAYSGFKTLQKAWQRHKLHGEATAKADELSRSTALSPSHGIDAHQTQKEREQEIPSTQWQDTVRASQNSAPQMSRGA